MQGSCFFNLYHKARLRDLDMCALIHSSMDATEQRQAMLTVEKFKVRSNSPRWLISCIDAVRTCLRISRRVSGHDEEGRFVPYIAFFLS